MPGQPATVPNTTALSREAKTKIAELLHKAAACWGSGSPAVIATGLSRIAVLSAEAGDQRQAADLLERARTMLRDERDAISADSTLSQVAVCFAIAGTALTDSQLFERGLGSVGELHGVGFKGLALAKIFSHLSETDDTSRSASVKKRLMSQMDTLSGFEYCLTVGEVVRVLAKSPAAKAEVVALLETGLARARADKLFGATAVRDIAIAYAKAARHLVDKELIERALDIAKELDGAPDQAAVYGDAAVAYAVLGLPGEAKQYLDMEKAKIQSIHDAWDSKQAAIGHIVGGVLVGTIFSDPTLLEASVKAADSAENRELAIISIVEALVDVAETKNDPRIAAKAGEIADRLEEPFDRNCRLADRIYILRRSRRHEEAEALLARALSDAESVNESNSRGSAYCSIAEAVLRSI